MTGGASCRGPKGGDHGGERLPFMKLGSRLRGGIPSLCLKDCSPGSELYSPGLLGPSNGDANGELEVSGTEIGAGESL